MSNMSYCRFENTVRDLQDCSYALEEMTEDDTEQLSKSETRAKKRLIQLCVDIADAYGDQDEDDDPVEEICNGPSHNQTEGN